MNKIYICGLAQEPGRYDRFLWMQVYGAHDTMKRAQDWIMMEVEESGIPGEARESDEEDEGEDNRDPAERQYFEALDKRSFYFVQEKGINSLHEETWRLMPDRTWKKLGD